MSRLRGSLDFCQYCVAWQISMSLVLFNYRCAGAEEAAAALFDKGTYNLLLNGQFTAAPKLIPATQ